MRAVSDRFLDGITSSHRMEVEVALGSQVLPLDGGTVTLDITASTRGRADLTFSDMSLIPVTHADVLAPYDNELTIKRGIRYAEGDIELVQLGIHRIEEVEIADEISVSLLDRSQRIIDAKFEAAGSVAAGTDYATAITNLVATAGTITTNFPTLSYTTPEISYQEGDDRWDFAQGLATLIGMDLYFDNNGVLTLTPVPDLASEPKAYLVEGKDGLTVKPTLLDLTKHWSRTDTFNVWTVVGENPNENGTPPRSQAIDDDPNSPTYFATFGRKPADVYSSPYISTQAQADAAAQGFKRKELGTSQTLDFGAMVNPALEPGDVVRITRTRRNPLNLDQLIEIADENHIIDSLTIPLDVGTSMTGTTRAIKVTG